MNRINEKMDTETGTPPEAPGPAGPSGPIVEMKLTEAETYVLFPRHADESEEAGRFWRFKSPVAVKLRARILTSDQPLEPGLDQVFSAGGFADTAVKAMATAGELLTTKHGKLPPRQRLEFTQTLLGSDEPQKLTMPGVAAPAYVLGDAMAVGADLDAAFAISGEVSASGTLAGTHRVGELLAEAAESGIKGMIVWSAAAEFLADTLIAGRLEPMIRVQVFRVERVDEALKYMARERSDEVEEAVGLFTDIEELLNQYDAAGLMKNSSVVKRLEQIVDLCPDHLSAGLLLKYGRGELPDTMSPSGSWLAIEEVADPPLRTAIGGGAEAYGTAFAEVSRDALFEMRNLRPLLHQNAMPYCNAVTDFLEAVEDYFTIENRATSIAQQKRLTMEQAGLIVASTRKSLVASFGLGDSD